jgi:hypothetical protein
MRLNLPLNQEPSDRCSLMTGSAQYLGINDELLMVSPAGLEPVHAVYETADLIELNLGQRPTGKPKRHDSSFCRRVCPVGVWALQTFSEGTDRPQVQRAICNRGTVISSGRENQK